MSDYLEYEVLEDHVDYHVFMNQNGELEVLAEDCSTEYVVCAE